MPFPSSFSPAKKEKKDSPPEWTKKKSYFQKMQRKEGEKDEEGRIKSTSFLGSRLSVKVGVEQVDLIQ